MIYYWSPGDGMKSEGCVSNGCSTRHSFLWHDIGKRKFRILTVNVSENTTANSIYMQTWQVRQTKIYELIVKLGCIINKINILDGIITSPRLYVDYHSRSASIQDHNVKNLLPTCVNNIIELIPRLHR